TFQVRLRLRTAAIFIRAVRMPSIAAAARFPLSRARRPGQSLAIDGGKSTQRPSACRTAGTILRSRACRRRLSTPARNGLESKKGRHMRAGKLLSGLLVALAFAGAASAQTTLRIGLAEDPDVLDPTLARTYVGRIVFAALCDKLFDIDDKLNVVPQLAVSHQVSPDGKAVTIKLRPGVKFHDGEPFNAEATKFNIERHLTMQGSFRKAEIAQIDKV